MNWRVNLSRLSCHMLVADQLRVLRFATPCCAEHATWRAQVLHMVVRWLHSLEEGVYHNRLHASAGDRPPGSLARQYLSVHKVAALLAGALPCNRPITPCDAETAFKFAIRGMNIDLFLFCMLIIYRSFCKMGTQCGDHLRRSPRVTVRPRMQ